MKSYKAKVGMFVYLKVLLPSDVLKGYVLGDIVVIHLFGRKTFKAANGDEFLWAQVTRNPRKVPKR